jgi:hypothetical protein
VDIFTIDTTTYMVMTTFSMLNGVPPSDLLNVIYKWNNNIQQFDQIGTFGGDLGLLATGNGISSIKSLVQNNKVMQFEVILKL